MSVYFITGIDTDIGKTFTTGLMARYLMKQGLRVVTQKIVQTGMTQRVSDDILTHRRLMEIEPFAEDLNGMTCPYVFSFPASPHLAAEMENRNIDSSVITSYTNRLLETFDTVLLEGAGGLHVPIKRNFSTVDYINERKYPIVITSSGRLGSVNHTLMTLESVVCRKIPLAGIVFNHHPPSNALICNDSLKIFREQLRQYGRDGALVEIPAIDLQNIPDIDFSPLFQIDTDEK